MGRLRTLTILLTFGACGAATDGAPPGEAAPPAAPSSRPKPPAPPSEYVRAGAKLFKGGQFDLAAKYFKAADDYRDQLSAVDQTELDKWRVALAKAQPAGATAAIEPAPTPTPAAPEATAPAAGPDAAPATNLETAPPASLEAAPPASPEAAPPATSPLAAPAEPEAGAVRVGANDAKQRARWLLQQAREHIGRGEFDQAQAKVDEARAFDVRWGLFDDTPAKVVEALSRARPKVAVAATAGARHDRHEAKARLKEARAALAANRYDQAEAIALDVQSWGVYFGILEDNPRKVASAARALRDRDGLRQVGTKAHAGQEVYDVLVRESRELAKAGRLDEAEAKARRAQRMNVVPGVTADRAEAVLADVTAARSRATAPVPAPAPGSVEAPAAVAEPPSVLAEREANDLLQRKETEAAKLKFAEAERLRAKEAGQQPPSESIAMASPVADPSIQKAQAAPAATEPAPVPAPAAAEPVPAPVPAPEPAAAEPAPAPVAAEAGASLPDLGVPAPVAPPTNPADPVPAPVVAEAAVAAPPAAIELAPAPAQPAPAPAQPAPAAPAVGNPGEAMLAQARSLMSQGNFAEARQLAAKTKAGGFGVDAQADELTAQVALAEQGGALSLYEAALAAVRKGDNGRARALLGEVVAAGDALDEGTLQRVQDLLMKLPRDGDGKAIVADVNDAEALKAQQLNAEVGTRLAEARRLMETDPDKAISLLQTQVEAVKAAGLSPSVTRTMARRLEVAIDLSRKDKVAFDVKMRDKSYRDDIERRRLRILEADKAKKDQVKTFMERGQTAYAEGDYVNAEKFAMMAQEIAPNMVEPVALVFKARTERHYKYDLDLKQRKEEGFLNQMQAADEAGIPTKDVLDRSIDFGKDAKTFGDLTKRRKKYDLRSLSAQRDPKVQEIERKLNEPVDLNFAKQPLEEAITYLQNYTGLNIVLDHKALADEALTPATPVSLTVNKVKLKTSLKLLLAPLGLTYKLADEVLLITSPQSNRTDLVTRAYDVADLVITPHGKAGQNPSAPQLPGTGTAGGTGMPTPGQTDPQSSALGGGSNSLGVAPQFNKGPSSTSGERPKVDMMPLIQLITASVAPGSWKVTQSGDPDSAYGLGQGLGGADAAGEGEGTPIGSITPFFLNISLIIRHTAEVHEDVVDLLRQLRKLQDLQISVEVRFITVNDNFFEQLGVDFDVSIASKAAGKKTSFAQVRRTTTTAGTTTGTTAGTAATAGNLFLIDPVRDNVYGPKAPIIVGRQSAGDPGNFTPNLQIPFTNGSFAASAPSNLIPNVGSTFGIAFLSDLEVYLFLAAIQGDARSNIVQAPKVTSFNGAPAIISSTNQIYYVASLIPLIGAGAGAFLPSIGVIPDGVTLFVTPVVSADRRYVRMTLSPQFVTFNGFTTISVPIVAGGGGLGGGGAVANGTIQLPNLTLNFVSTTVTVPDGGTVLLGGVKRLREERTEYGTPMLSKVPFINRLFRNIGIGRRTDSLMLMVTPRIIILEEEEERLGIPTVPTVSF